MLNSIRFVKSSYFFSSTSNSISQGETNFIKILPNPSKKFFSDRSNLGAFIAHYKNLTFSLAGFFSVLHVKGIGFKVFYFRHKHALYFILGYNHITKFFLPSSIYVKVRKQYILLFSNDKSVLGQTTSFIMRLRYPDPYRGKGIRYRFQIIKFKPGKQR